MSEATRKQLAKDVAKELDWRRRRRKLIFFILWAILIVLAILWLRCGRGWGLGGGGGTGMGSEPAPQPAVGSAAIAHDAAPARCTLRVSADGITVDGTPVTRDEAVARCRTTDGAMVTVTGDARQGDWDELRASLQAAGVKIYIRGELWDGKDPPPAHVEPVP